MKPESILVVDDGSTDGTETILSHYQESRASLVNVVRLPNRGYDIRRVPRNINLAWRSAAARHVASEFFMISGDDCGYPSNYARELIQRMRSRPHIVVASGKPSSETTTIKEHTPSGSGRMIRCSFWREIGEAYPVKAGWETWLLYKAIEMGLGVLLYEDLVFEHVRPRGTEHQFSYWGAAMHTLGYHPLYALGRVAKNFLQRGIGARGTLSMLRGYLAAYLGSSDSFLSPFDQRLRRFVCQEQSRKIRSLVEAPLSILS